jgi:HTH-type transcriptional regulator/antitoxin HigA
MKTIQKNKKSYIELLTEFPPRPIHSQADLDAVQKVVYELIDRGKLNADEEDYLSLLGTLVHQYEEIHHPIPDIYGVELIDLRFADF